jgi:hypothetical protein
MCGCAAVRTLLLQSSSDAPSWALHYRRKPYRRNNLYGGDAAMLRLYNRQGLGLQVGGHCDLGIQQS